MPVSSFDALQKQFGLQVDTLAVDCEGCFDQILKDFPDIVDKISTILLEADYGIGWQRQGTADYKRIKSGLEAKGFKAVVEDTVQDDPNKGKIMYYVFKRATGVRST